MPVTVKKYNKQTGKNDTLITSDVCPHCPHTVSQHDELKARHCNLCACVAQDAG